jgi:putative spermidine/putrescine transport system permease protein
LADRLGRSGSATSLHAYLVIAAVFLVAPIVAVTIGSLTTTQYVVFPPRGITLKWYGQIFDRPEMLSSFLLSLGIAAAAATISTFVALVASLALARYRTSLNKLLWTFLVSPLMLPATVLGFAFLQSYTSMGFGSSPGGLLAGHVVLVTPYAVALTVTGLRAVDPALEEAARSLGASPVRALRLVVLPMMLWSLGAGWVMAFLVSFGDAAVSIFLNTPEMVTLPVRIFDALRYSPLNPQLTALSSVLILVTLGVLVIAALFARPERLLAPATGNDPLQPDLKKLGPQPLSSSANLGATAPGQKGGK